MYKKNLFLLQLFSLSVIFCSAQRTSITDKSKTSTTTTVDRKSIEQLPFSRNFNEFAIMQNFGYTHTSPENSDNHTNNVNLNIDYNRFVMDHVGVGVELDLSSSKSESPNAFSKSTNWMLYGDVIYGTTINNDFNLYGKLSVGFGEDKFSATNTTSPKHNQFGYKFEVGSPIHMFDGGGNYITPFIGYNYIQQKNSSGKTSDNEFNFGFRFQNYSPCDAYECDSHHDRIFSRNSYNTGRSFIGYTSWGDFGFGKSKFEYGNTSFEDDISSGALNFEYGYYFIPNLAIGAGVNLNSQSTKSGSTKYTSSQFVFMPMVTANLPVDNCLNNLFLQGGYGFGSEKNSSGSGDQKTNITNYCFNLGYNDYFSKHIALTPKIGYEWEIFKNTSTNIKTKFSGLEFGLGCSMHF
jgi:hypothetical protein